MAEARDLFRDSKRTEFVIVTIPTLMAVSESCRLASTLKKEGVPLHTLIINQVGGGGEGTETARRYTPLVHTLCTVFSHPTPRYCVNICLTIWAVTRPDRSCRR